MRFTIRATASPMALPLLIAQFATRALIPSRIVAEQVGPLLEVVIEHPTMDEMSADALREDIDSIVGIEQVTVWTGRHSLPRVFPSASR